MSEPFLSEIRMMSFQYAPRGWALCNGQLLPINQNQALFSLLGTTYGGNGQTTFGLPNLQGRVPIHFGNGHSLGESAGAATHTLNIQQIPGHTHQVSAVKEVGTSAAPGPSATLAGQNANPYGKNPDLSGGPVASSVGGSQPHENCQPFLTISFCIALQGIFPSQT